MSAEKMTMRDRNQTYIRISRDSEILISIMTHSDGYSSEFILNLSLDGEPRYGAHKIPSLVEYSTLFKLI